MRNHARKSGIGFLVFVISCFAHASKDADESLRVYLIKAQAIEKIYYRHHPSDAEQKILQAPYEFLLSDQIRVEPGAQAILLFPKGEKELSGDSSGEWLRLADIHSTMPDIELQPLNEKLNRDYGRLGRLARIDEKDTTSGFRCSVVISPFRFSSGARISPGIDVNRLSDSPIANGLNEILIANLLKVQRFEIAETAESSPIDDPTSRPGEAPEQQPKNLESRHFAIVPEITLLEKVSRNENPFGALGNISGVMRPKESATINLGIRLLLIDREGLRIIGAADSSSSIDIATGGMKTIDFDLSTGKATPVRLLVDEALRKAAGLLAHAALKESFDARVVNADPAHKQVILNVGRKDGAEVGLELEVFSADRQLIDPGSAESGFENKPVGRLVIRRVENNTAYAEVIEGSTFQRGDRVKAKIPAGSVAW